MKRILIITVLIYRVKLEMQTSHEMYLSRSRSDAAPVQSYVYNQVNKVPRSLTSFNPSFHENGAFEALGDLMHYSRYSEDLPMDVPVRSPGSEKAEMDYHRSRMDSELAYERMKSLMHYDSSADKHLPGYNDIGNNYYHLDENDVRTSSMNYYESLPLPFGSYDGDVNEKLIDKRNSYHDNREFIPVNENSIEVDEIARYNRGVLENPLRGSKPFFSFILSDYFDKNNDQDPLTFKGIGDWDFDDMKTIQEPKKFIYNTIKLPNNEIPSNDQSKNIITADLKSAFTTPSYAYDYIHGFSGAQKAYEKLNKFDKQDENHEHKSDNNFASTEAGQTYGGFKDFVDTFAQKFAKDDDNKKSKFSLKLSQDKGEKKKGFKRVYHKNEFQEDDEFYDNTNKQASAEETGGSDKHGGNIKVFTKSHSSANLGEILKGYNKSDNESEKNDENNHSGHDSNEGVQRDINRFIDVARDTVENNRDFNDYHK